MIQNKNISKKIIVEKQYFKLLVNNKTKNLNKCLIF